MKKKKMGVRELTRNLREAYNTVATLIRKVQSLEKSNENLRHDIIDQKKYINHLEKDTEAVINKYKNMLIESHRKLILLQDKKLAERIKRENEV